MRANGGWIVVMALVLGCLSPPAESTDPEAARGPATVSDPPEPVVAAAPEPEPARVAVAEPAPQTWVPIELPYPPDAVVLRPVVDMRPVVLFPDEADAIRRGVAKGLRAHGLTMIPVEELERIEAAAAEGRLVLEGDQACRAPLQPSDLVARYFATRRYVEIEAGCFNHCRLQISLQDPNDPETYQGFGSRKVARVHDPRAWVAVADQLHEEQTWGAIGLGMLGSSHPPPIRFGLPVGVGPWTRPLEELSFHEAERFAAACAHPDPLVGFTYVVRASVDRRGEQLRCVASTKHTMARPADAACVCQALRALDLPEGPPGRRLQLDAIDDGGSRGSWARLEQVQPGTEPWVRRFDESPMLARCLQDNPLPRFEARMRVSLEPDGGVANVRLDGDITTRESMQFAACVVQEARTVALPCRPPGIDQLVLRLVVDPR